jgi:vitamin B12 transporter
MWKSLQAGALCVSFIKSNMKSDRRIFASRLLEQNQETNMPKVSALIAGVLLVTTAAPAAHAADTSLETVVITATRTLQPAARTGDSISVITGQRLDQQQVVAVSDALAQTPGLVILRDGGPGQTTTMALRGAEAGQTLVLVDGVRINDPSTVDGQALIGDVMVNNIARIEVLRGPQSTLYGSDAIGGVVNILTKRGGAGPLAGTLSAEGGSFDSYRLNGAAHGTFGRFDYGAAANYFHTNGISAADARHGNSETDGTGNLGLTANTRTHILPGLSIDLRAYYTRARTGFDDNYLPPTYQISDSPVYERNNLFAGYAGLNLTLLDGRLHNRFAYIATSSRRTIFDSPFYLPLQKDYAYRGTARQLEYQGIFDINAQSQLTFGAEHQRSGLQSEVAGFSDARGHKDTTGLYLQGQTTLFDQLTVTGGIRRDDDREFGSHTSLKLAGAWTPNGGASVLRANYGDGFKAPTLYELYSAYSNPVTTLAPETARGWEVGIDQHLWRGRLLLSATWFERRTSDLIDFFSCYGVTSPACAQRSAVGGYYYNVGHTRSRGLELMAAVTLSETLSLHASYTNMHAIDALTHADLARRPHNLANAQINWQACHDWSFGASALYVGRRFDSAGGFNPLPGHVTENLYIAHKIGEHLELYGRIENLLNAHYEPVSGYGAPGRAIYGGVRLHY